MPPFQPYQYIVIPLITVITSNIIKFIYFISKDKKYTTRIKWILTWASGMPSTHSAVLTSLSLTIGLYQGFTSPLFAIITLISLIRMYDLILENKSYALVEKHITKARYKQFIKLVKEGNLERIVGHTSIEVLAGIILGLLVSLSFYYF